MITNLVSKELILLLCRGALLSKFLSYLFGGLILKYFMKKAIQHPKVARMLSKLPE